MSQSPFPRHVGRRGSVEGKSEASRIKGLPIPKNFFGDTSTPSTPTSGKGSGDQKSTQHSPGFLFSGRAKLKVPAQLARRLGPSPAASASAPAPAAATAASSSSSSSSSSSLPSPHTGDWRTAGSSGALRPQLSAPASGSTSKGQAPNASRGNVKHVDEKLRANKSSGAVMPSKHASRFLRKKQSAALRVTVIGAQGGANGASGSSTQQSDNDTSRETRKRDDVFGSSAQGGIESSTGYSGMQGSPNDHSSIQSSSGQSAIQGFTGQSGMHDSSGQSAMQSSSGQSEMRGPTGQRRMPGTTSQSEIQGSSSQSAMHGNTGQSGIQSSSGQNRTQGSNGRSGMQGSSSGQGMLHNSTADQKGGWSLSNGAGSSDLGANLTNLSVDELLQKVETQRKSWQHANNSLLSGASAHAMGHDESTILNLTEHSGDEDVNLSRMLPSRASNVRHFLSRPSNQINDDFVSIMSPQRSRHRRTKLHNDVSYPAGLERSAEYDNGFNFASEMYNVSPDQTRDDIDGVAEETALYEKRRLERQNLADSGNPSHGNVVGRSAASSWRDGIIFPDDGAAYVRENRGSQRSSRRRTHTEGRMRHKRHTDESTATLGCLREMRSVIFEDPTILEQESQTRRSLSGTDVNALMEELSLCGDEESEKQLLSSRIMPFLCGIPAESRLDVLRKLLVMNPFAIIALMADPRRFEDVVTALLQGNDEYIHSHCRSARKPQPTSYQAGTPSPMASEDTCLHSDNQRRLTEEYPRVLSATSYVTPSYSAAHRAIQTDQSALGRSISEQTQTSGVGQTVNVIATSGEALPFVHNHQEKERCELLIKQLHDSLLKVADERDTLVARLKEQTEHLNLSMQNADALLDKCRAARQQKKHVQVDLATERARSKRNEEAHDQMRKELLSRLEDKSRDLVQSNALVETQKRVYQLEVSSLTSRLAKQTSKLATYKAGRLNTGNRKDKASESAR